MIACCVGGAYVVGAAIGLILTRGPMPTAGNIILPEGIGPLALRDVDILKLPHLPTLGKAFWLAITAASLLGAGLLVGAAAGAAAAAWPSLKLARIRPDQTGGLFFFLCGGIYLSPIMVTGGWDRYYVPALVFLLAGIAALTSRSWPGQTRARLALAALLLAGLAAFAVFGTKDYLARNRARWMALNDLLASGQVTPADVDGGFEFNGWYLYDPGYKEDPAKSWYWVQRDTYLLAFGETPGWRTLKEYSYPHWLPPYAGRILVLKKAPADNANQPRPAPAAPALPPQSGSPP
jgi:hypothetical protein